MKKITSSIFIVSMLMLVIPIASALYGGETETIFDGECSELLVNISIDPSQDDGEYQLVPNCTELSFENNIKSFKCICLDNETILNLTIAANSVGNYTYTLEPYVLEDNETTQPKFYNITNPTSRNITATITLPNNGTVERIIPPGESLVYAKTKEDYIIIPEPNVTFQSISTDGQNINIQATSSGEKCFDIYASQGAPYSVTVNDGSVSFTYDNTAKLIHFCLTFSTKNIAITWVIPTPSALSVSGSGAGTTGGGGSGFSYPAIVEEKTASPPSATPEEKAPEEKEEVVIPEIEEAPPEVAPAPGILARITGGIVAGLGGLNKSGIIVVVVVVLLCLVAYSIYRRNKSRSF